MLSRNGSRRTSRSRRRTDGELAGTAVPPRAGKMPALRPAGRPGNWLALVNAARTAKELARVRLSVARGQPYGEGPWVAETVRALGLEHTVRPEGRPREAAREGRHGN
jgi:hypothetical protein